MLNCAAKALLGEAAATVLKIIGIAQDAGSFIEAVKSGKPDKIIIESLRLALSLFTLKSQCFTGDTLVSTYEGDRRIDDIEIGDYVWSYDTENVKKTLVRVTDVSVTETDVLVHVFTSDGEDIETTMFHPFYVKDTDNLEKGGVWAAASNLVNGQELYTEDGKIVYVQEVRVEKLDESIKVYNLEIERLHTYFVAGGVLVHNSCKVENSDTIIDEDIVMDSANAPGKGGYENVAGHSLNKHSNRHPDIWGKLSGGSQVINSKAVSIIREILNSDKIFKIVESNGKSFYEIMLDDNRGIRLNMDMTFKGFIDERR